MTKKSKSGKKRPADHGDRGKGAKTAGRRKLADHLPALFVVAFLVIGLGAMAWNYMGPGGMSNGMSGDASSGAVTVAVKVPKLSPAAAEGKKAFDANCAACHGANGAGTNNGPPFIHTIYNPGHHDNRAFLRAVRNGVPQHHWSFGDMPPQPQVSDKELIAIVRYVRELQEANGIVYQKHIMQ